MNQISNPHEISAEESKPTDFPGSANVVMASKLIFAILGLPFLRLFLRHCKKKLSKTHLHPLFLSIH